MNEDNVGHCHKCHVYTVTTKVTTRDDPGNIVRLCEACVKKCPKEYMPVFYEPVPVWAHKRLDRVWRRLVAIEHKLDAPQAHEVRAAISEIHEVMQDRRGIDGS